MRIIILGVNGMLGHKLYQVLKTSNDTFGTIRTDYMNIKQYEIFDKSTIISGINALDIFQINQVLNNIKPDILINCIGIVKSLEKTSGTLLNIQINSVLPHQLYQSCIEKGIRLIHVSTDCVYNGGKGNYKEEDISNAEDIYGKTKFLGEVCELGALTIRTSFIGRELSTSNGLCEWFLSNQHKQVNGYNNAVFSGFPTLHLARIINEIITKYKDLYGIYHIAAGPISKFHLLTLIKEKLKLDIEIIEYPDFYCDRSLDSTLFRIKTGFKPLTWEKMIEEFAEDAKQYEHWR